MKIRHLLGMAAVALMAAACSNDVNDVLTPEAPQKVKHLIATIAPKTFDATTRALVDNENGTLSASWEVGETMALSLIAGYSFNTTAEVKKVNDDGSAIIEADFSEFTPEDGSTFEISYPADYNYLEQDGTLSTARDIRFGVAKVKVDGDVVTFTESITLQPQCAIVGFTLTDITKNDALFVKKMVITFKYEGVNYLFTITPTDLSNADYLYVTMFPSKDTEVWFEATSRDGNPYIAKGTANLEAGKFYQTDLKMATVGNVIGSDGKFYKDAAAAGTAAEAMIAYLGTEAEDADHGLAIALEKASANYVTWDATGENNGGKTAAELVDAWANIHAVTGGTWRLPSAYDWQRMFIGCGSTHEYVSSLSNMEFGYGNFFTLWKSATSSSFLSYCYWTSTTSGSECAWVVSFESSTVSFDGQQYKDCIYRVQACLAF